MLKDSSVCWKLYFYNSTETQNVPQVVDVIMAVFSTRIKKKTSFSVFLLRYRISLESSEELKKKTVTTFACETFPSPSPLVFLYFDRQCT